MVRMESSMARERWWMVVTNSIQISTGCCFWSSERRFDTYLVDFFSRRPRSAWRMAWMVEMDSCGQ
jgi:hypothetical protein